MPFPKVPPHDHTRFSRGGRLTSAAISGLTQTPPADGGTGGGGLTDHGALGGLADDDHSAYVTVLGGGGETVNTVAATGASETIDLGLGNVHDFTLTAATVTLSLSGSTAGVSDSVTVVLRQDGTGGRLVTWPGAVSWPGGTTPVLGTAANAIDVFTLFTLNGGTNWYGFHANSGGTVVAALDDLTDVAITSPEEGARLRYTSGTWVDSLSFPEILISDTPSTPLIFADLIQTEAEDDLVYSDP